MARPRLGLGTYGSIRSYRTPAGWRAETLFRDMDGRTRPVKRSGPTKAKAVDILKSALRDRQHRGGVDLSRDHSFAEAGERWLAEVHRKRSGRTYDQYRCCLRNRLVPALGELALRECTVGVLDRYVETLEAELKPNAIRGVRTVLSGVMGYAVRMDALERNPVREIADIVGGGKVSRALGRAEREEFLEKLDADERAQADDLPDLLRYMLGTGVRLSEALSLRWFRVDLVEGVVVHGDNLSRVTGQGIILKEPKTEAGFRVLPMPDFVKLMLQLRYPGPEFSMCPVFPKFPTYPVLNSTERRSSRSCRRVGPERLYPYRPVARDGGRYMIDAWRDPNNTTRSIAKFRDAAGFPWFTSHVCRHTAATVLDEQGLTAREISGYLGHARPSFTQDKYMDRKQQSGAAGRGMDAAMRPARAG